jgi:NADH-quinone oxidoreductase subunit N
MAVIEAKMYTLAIVGLLTTVVSAFYYLMIIKVIYFDKAKEPFEESSDFGLNISLTISSILILIYFIYPSILIDVVSTLTFF